MVGLAWEIVADVPGQPAPELPVAYNICRQGPQDPDFVRINREPDPAEPGSFVEAPVLIATIDLDGNYETLQDQVLPDVLYQDQLGPEPELGTYHYKITGVDIFGRESQPSAPIEVTVADLEGPAAPRNLQVRAEQARATDGSAPVATVTLNWDWTRLEAKDNTDLGSFKVYRRWGTNALDDTKLGCPCDVEPPDGCPGGVQLPDGWTLQGTIPASHVAQRFTQVGALSPAEQATLGDLLPLDRFELSEQVALPEGPAVQHAYYRIVAYDARGNAGAISGPVGATVVDNRPATPPDEVQPLFSYNAWDETVTVHLSWETPDATAAGGYKLLRAARRPSCAATTDCPSECDDEGACTQIACIGGFCGGPDNGPSGHRQLDREAMLTNGVLPHNSGAGSSQRSTLKALAALGNLWERDAETGARLPVAAACALDGSAAGDCDTQLDTAIGPGRTQYAHDVLPAKASAQVYFYRVMAVSRGGIQELDEVLGDPNPRSTISAAFPIQIPDFIPPRKPTWSQVVSQPRPSGCAPGQDAVELSWKQDPARDTRSLVAGYRIWRERAPCSGTMVLLNPIGTLFRPSATPVGVGSWTVVTGDADTPLPTFRLCDVPPTPETDYCYALELVDQAGNVSERSDVAVIRSVDTTPPAVPTALAAARVAGVPVISWIHDEGNLRVTVQRSVQGEGGPWRVLVSDTAPGDRDDLPLLDPPTAYRFADQTAKATKDYWYRVVVHDGGGNASDREDPAARAHLEATP